MLTLAAAETELTLRLRDSPRARHSRGVAEFLGQIASRLGEDRELWAVTGLLHDIDFEVTSHQPHRHGLVAAGWLAGRLPPAGLDAIRSHDHRSGVVSTTRLARALKCADALAVIVETLGAAAPGAIEMPVSLPQHLASRPWLAPLLYDNAAALGLAPTVLADIVRASGYATGIDA